MVSITSKKIPGGRAIAAIQPSLAAHTWPMQLLAWEELPQQETELLHTLVFTGEFSEVYSTTPHAGSQEPVALKFYQRAQVSQSADLTRRVLREKHALDLTRLHPHPFLVGGRFAYFKQAIDSWLIKIADSQLINRRLAVD